MSELKSFTGTGWSFPPQFLKVTRSAMLLSDEDDIMNSLQVLLGTRVGERIMQPKYGCNLDEMVFEPMNVTLETYIKELVFTAIFYFEPRIKPEQVTLTSGNDGMVTVNVEYIIRSTNTRHNLVFPFYLNEGANIQP